MYSVFSTEYFLLDLCVYAVMAEVISSGINKTDSDMNSTEGSPGEGMMFL